MLHLHASDHLGIATTTSQEAFAALFGEIQRGRKAGHSSAMETRLRFPSLNGQELLERWFAQAMELSNRLAVRDPVGRADPRQLLAYRLIASPNSAIDGMPD